jgi:cysteine-rich repeat protein
MRRHRVPLAILAAAALVPGTVRALDLNGKWRFTSQGPTQIVQVTQSGNALSFTYGFPFTGTVTPGSPFATFTVMADVSPNVAGIFGRITPSENVLHGRAAGFFPPNPPVAGPLVATRCTCDDGNTASGDGCDAECRVEPCWTCAGDPSVCTPAPDGSSCDDGTFCTTGETCTAGVCGGGAPVSPCVDMTATWTRHRDIPDLGQTFDFVSDIVQRGTDVFAGGYLGTIDSATGAFDLAAVNSNIFCPPFDTLVGTLAATNATYSATGIAWEPNPFAPDHCNAFPQFECGSTAPGPIESCPGTPTTTSTSTTTTTTVPSGSTCAAGPVPGCRVPTESHKAKLLLKDKTPDAGDVVTWKWTKGAATTLAELGDPVATTNYVACLYDGASALRMTLRMPAGGTCGSAPCWKPKDAKGFTYSDKERTPDGVKKLTLASGPAGKAKIALTAKGDAIPLPAPFGFALPLRVQLQGNGLCWEAIYSTAQQNSATQFKAVSD